jgi:cytoplasmic iron level regulating protein YaaA (DUF328/UPF0246 family)
MDKTKLNIIVSCVSNKSVEIPDELQFRNIKLDTIKNMGDKWIENLITSNSIPISAHELYAGSAWNTIVKTKQLTDNLENYDVEWYIMSVGYGLIKWNQKIKPYSITFSKPSFDGLRKRKLKPEANRQWWDYITTKRNLKIKDIATQNATTIIMGSTEYINAVKEDLKHSHNFMIFSSTYNASNYVNKHVQTHEKLRFIVGGGKVDNNSRNLQYYLKHIDEWGHDLNIVNQKFKQVIDSIQQELPEVNRDREKLDDKEIQDILKEMGIDRPMAHYIQKIRIEMNKKISEQVIITHIQKLKEKSSLPS